VTGVSESLVALQLWWVLTKYLCWVYVH